MQPTSDLRIESLSPLVPPRVLKAELPITEEAAATVLAGRRAVEDIIAGRDDRLLAVVGPCSIHDVDAGLEYARRLSGLQREMAGSLVLVMRVYFEKPRTRLGWRGLILDPNLDGSYDIALGLRRARRFLLDVAHMGLPTGSEMLDPIVPQYLDDLVSWASIGARTTESQTHREMASGLSMPVGFKNGTDGSIDVAVNALASSCHPHSFIGIDQDGRTSVLTTKGNRMGHIILRGGREGPNYDRRHLQRTAAALEAAGVLPAIMVDCSHGNSGKDHTRQGEVLRSVLGARRDGLANVIGFMMESNLVAGRQEPPGTPEEIRVLVYGRSITDACIGWEETVELLREAGTASIQRRSRRATVG